MTFAPLGARATPDGVTFSVHSATAARIWVSIFDQAGNAETARVELARNGADTFSVTIPGLTPGARYGLRADGDHHPEQGLWFDPDKLLVDPYAIELDRPFAYHPDLTARRGSGPDTASLVPKAIVQPSRDPVAHRPPVFRPGGLIYELSVRGFTMLHPGVPEQERGTLKALAHPAVIAHLQALRVSAVELMPVTAWIDERHLRPLKLSNAWGYNPVAFMALDPRLAPGGVAELRETVLALRQAGIGVILDLVFNHTGESDAFGPTLSLRGLDARTYYRHTHDDPPKLVNDTGTGNTIACDRPMVRRLILDSLRHFVTVAGVDGFRFDLAPILGRSETGFDPKAALFREMREDELLADRVMIAEPWDIGPGGYQLGNFPLDVLEWNDRCRDDVRRFWRGDRGMRGALATRLAGSSDVFGGDGAAATRTVNFIAAHDGMTLSDLTAYERKHNEANGELNRDGHDENLSWNNGVEGASDDPSVRARRDADRRALLATLFASRGTIMLTAGDEFGRTQQGNNNAYAQDNAISWLDWKHRDQALEAYVVDLAALRAQGRLDDPRFLAAQDNPDGGPTALWLDTSGEPMTQDDWQDPSKHRLAVVTTSEDCGRLAILVNGDRRATTFALPDGSWELVASPGSVLRLNSATVAGRAVAFAKEVSGG